MNLADWVIVSLIAVWFLVVCTAAYRRKKSVGKGCHGDCGGCRGCGR